jgi:hypothetical protein
MKDILNAVAKTRRALARQYPGASELALAGAVTEMVTIALADPKADLSDAALLFDMAVDAADTEWSAELSDILLEKVVRPEYDKAIEAEVDPITVIRANCGMTEKKAREVVAKLTAAYVSTPTGGDVLMGDGSVAASDEPETARV